VLFIRCVPYRLKYAANVSRGKKPFLACLPERHSGGKPTLLGISKRGDVYLRTLLIHGARAVTRVPAGKARTDAWLKRLLDRRHKNVAAVALANKNARTAWALLVHGRDYRPDYTSSSTPVAA
ncbi:MAG: transposase, partial [Acidiferrobacter thiooxydans]